jgi:hypothetical protein
MELQRASKKKAKIKMAIQGPSGSGKTMSSLLIAYGLCGSWERVSVLDTENRSADLYSDLGRYNVLQLTPPFSPERYNEAIDICVNAGMEVIIIDTSSREWDFLLDYHSSLPGSSFNSWAKVSPRHEAFVNKMLQANAHIICTIRSKTEYVISEKNGKQVVEKVGMKGVQRENLEYELSLVFEMDMLHRAKATKDRTSLFEGKPEFIPSIETGARILEWCNAGTDVVTPPSFEDVLQAIHECTTIVELSELYYKFPVYQEVLKKEFAARKETIINAVKQQTIEHGAAITH